MQTWRYNARMKKQMIIKGSCYNPSRITWTQKFNWISGSPHNTSLIRSKIPMFLTHKLLKSDHSLSFPTLLNCYTSPSVIESGVSLKRVMR